MAVPSPGAIIELSGSRLHQVDFVFVHRAEEETLQLNAFNISEGSIYFEWPQVTQTAYLSVLGSNKVPMLVGNGLQIEMMKGVVGFMADSLVVPFFLSEAPSAAKTKCVGTSGESTVWTAPVVDGCQLRCELPAHRLWPGEIHIALSLEGEPEERSFGTISLVGLRGEDLSIANHTVFAGSETSRLRIDASQQLDLEKQLWCTYSSQAKRKVEAMQDEEGAWCKGVPREPGAYTVGLTYDEVNYIDAPEPLIVHDRASVVVTDVSPRLVPLEEVAAR